MNIFFSDSCKKCQGHVFEMERVSFKSSMWHKQCFNCANCKYTLTNTLDDVFDREGQLYCRPCLKKHFGDEYAKPTSVSDTKKVWGIFQPQFIF